MRSAPPLIRNFSAWVDLQPGAPPRLNVVGEVETSAGNRQPQLSRAESQGIVPTHLILDLTIVEVSGVGTADVAFRSVRYTERDGKGQYTSIQIRWGSKTIVTLKVGETH